MEEIKVELIQFLYERKTMYIDGYIVDGWTTSARRNAADLLIDGGVPVVQVVETDRFHNYWFLFLL